MKKFFFGFLLIIQLSISSFSYKADFKHGIKNLDIPKNTLNFLVLGDWGRDGNNIQKTVANKMTQAAYQLNVDFIISTGDNFYPNGVTSIYDSQLKNNSIKI